MRELLFERVFYILFSFAGISLALSFLMGQLTYTEQAKLTLDFMLAGIQISMILFSVFMGISLFKHELTVGSVSMVLSKPISRVSFLLGKYFGQGAIQTLVILSMSLVTLAIASSQTADFSPLPIIQTVTLILLEILVLNAVTYFFAVNAGAITASVVTLCIFCIGHIKETLRQALGEHLERSLIWTFADGIIPDLEIFNTKALASYGITVRWVEIGWASLYALCFALFFLILASLCFNRKDILT